MYPSSFSFENGAYEAAISTGAIGTVGAVYRFGNAIEGKDVLMEVIELDNATIDNIDNDGVATRSNVTNPITIYWLWNSWCSF